MEESKRARKAAFLTGLATFLGFILILPFMTVASDPRALPYILLYAVFFVISGQAIVGLLIALAAGFISYPFFKHLIKKQVSAKGFKWARIVSFIIALVIGFLTFFPTKNLVMNVLYSKGIVFAKDTNSDGKPDKWVYRHIFGITEIDYDTNLDGKPDVWEHYYNEGKSVTKEIDTDSDGKPNVWEYFRKGKLYERGFDTDLDGKIDKIEKY